MSARVFRLSCVCCAIVFKSKECAVHFQLISDQDVCQLKLNKLRSHRMIMVSGIIWANIQTNWIFKSNWPRLRLCAFNLLCVFLFSLCCKRHPLLYSKWLIWIAGSSCSRPKGNTIRRNPIQNCHGIRFTLSISATKREIHNASLSSKHWYR